MHSRHTHSRCRGTAEVELLFAVIVLIAVLFIVQASFRISGPRLDATVNAAADVFYDATGAGSPQYVGGDLRSVEGINVVRPSLPIRTHVTNPTANLQVNLGGGQTQNVTISAKAAAISGSWAYSAYPMRGDYAVHQDWFQRWADESHVEVIDPLGLAPAWPP